MKILVFILTIIVTSAILNNSYAIIEEDTIYKGASQLELDNNSNKENITIQNIIPDKPKNYLSEIIPIFTLLIGFFMGKVYDNWTNNKKVKSEGRDWIETFIQLQDPLVKQIANISNFLEANPPNSVKIRNPDFQLSLDCNEFKSLNEKSIIIYLRKEFKIDYAKSIKMAGQLKNIVRIIESNSNLFKESFENLRNNSGTHSLKFVNEFADFRLHLANYVDDEDYNSSPERKGIVNTIISLSEQYINKHVDGNTLNPFELSEQFFPKLLIATYDVRKHPEMIATIEYVTKCDQSIKDLKTERYYLKEKLKNIQGSYKQQLELITKITDELNLNVYKNK